MSLRVSSVNFLGSIHADIMAMCLRQGTSLTSNTSVCHTVCNTGTKHDRVAEKYGDTARSDNTVLHSNPITSQSSIMMGTWEGLQRRFATESLNQQGTDQENVGKETGRSPNEF